jgi:mitogen-activated protein kinase 1/3
LRELKLLRHFDHDNIIRILDVPALPSREGYAEVYLVLDLMPTDLHRVIQYERLSDDHCKYFTYQLLRGLKFIHSAGVLHRDLKPANLLVNDQCDLKICDFGLARADASKGDHPSFMTEYVATRWYRAPEVMLTVQRYTCAIDMWSAGCILAEMVSRRPLFPGNDYHDQLVRIFRILGSPTAEDYRAIKSHRGRQYIRSMQWQRKTPWDAILPRTNPPYLDLLDQLLKFNPERRIKAEDAIKHPYIVEYHDPEDEPDSEPIADELLSFDRCEERLSKEDLKCKSGSAILENRLN